MNHPSGLVHYVNEIPLGTDAKMEIATKLPCHPIKQDVKNGKPRFITHGKLPWNYGCIPQTWEDPSVDHCGHPGDNDPVDVVEVSGRAMPCGHVATVKVLGVLGLIDEGETDWKIIAVDSSHPSASSLEDISDVPPAMVAAIREWYRSYKVVDGKAPNDFLFGGEAKGKAFALDVLAEAHEAWRRLRDGAADKGKLHVPVK